VLQIDTQIRNAEKPTSTGFYTCIESFQVISKSDKRIYGAFFYDVMHQD